MLTLRAAPALLALLFLLLATRTRRPLRRCALLALGVTSAGLVVLPDLVAPPGPARAAAWTLATLFAAGLATLAVLLAADGALLLRREGRGKPQAATLAAGIVLAAVVGLAVATSVRAGRALTTTTLALTMPTAYLSSLFVCFLFLTKVRGRLRARHLADHVVVLGAGLDGGEVTPLLAGRLNRAVAVYRALAARGGEPDVIVSGGQGPDEERSEAEAMSRYVVARGVPRARVRRENHSHNTDENLTYSAVLMKRAGSGRRCVVVTSDFHVLRAALVMDRLGLRGSVVGARTAPVYWLTATTREFIAVIWYDRWAFLGLSALLLLPCLALLLPWR